MCPRSRTVVQLNTLTNTYRIIPVRCKTWKCPVCGTKRAANIWFKLQKGQPTRFITLTSKPLPGDTPLSLHQRCRPQVSRLMHLIKSKFGHCEYACVLETTRRGFPHYHILQRGCFIPQRWLSSTWQRLTGAKIVDIRQVRNTEGTAKYVCKYLLKTAADATRDHLGRVVSYSQNYLIGDRLIPQTAHLRNQFVRKHPLEVLESWPVTKRVTIVEGCFLLEPTTFTATDDDTSMREDTS